MAEKVKKEDIELLTDFSENKAIGKIGCVYYIVPQNAEEEPIPVDLNVDDNMKATGFEKGVAILLYEIDTQYDKRWESIWRDMGAMVTQSGYVIPLNDRLTDFNIYSAEAQKKLKYARSVFDNPAEILKVDKKIDGVNFEAIKGYFDIAISGLNNSFEKACDELSRAKSGSLLSERDREKALLKYQKTEDLINYLASKIKAKYQKLEANQEKTAEERKAAVQANINSILELPQRGI